MRDVRLAGLAHLPLVATLGHLVGADDLLAVNIAAFDRRHERLQGRRDMLISRTQPSKSRPDAGNITFRFRHVHHCYGYSATEMKNATILEMQPHSHHQN